MAKGRVLVTGVTGFLGSHVAIQLLNRGYHVLGTLRNMQRGEAVRSMIGKHTDQIAQLSLVEAELLEANWEEIMQGVDFVQHIASPFPTVLPKNEDELIRPAKEGALNVLRAAKKNGVQRVVMTSSVGAVSYGKTPAQLQATLDENDWTDVQNLKDSTPYFRSKTLAERAAWDFVANEGMGLELVTICPGGILGPLLEQDYSASVNIVLKSLDGKVPAAPKIGFEVIDVRSVADLHILAMEKPNAVGQRYIASSGHMNFIDVANLLRAHYPDKKIPKYELPNVLARLFSLVDATLKPILVDLGVFRKVDAGKAHKELGWNPISKEEAVLSCAKSAFALGLLK